MHHILIIREVPLRDSPPCPENKFATRNTGPPSVVRAKMLAFDPEDTWWVNDGMARYTLYFWHDTHGRV